MGTSTSSTISSWNMGSVSTGYQYPVCLNGNYFHPPSSRCLRGTTSVTSSSCGSSQIWNGVGCSDIGMSNTCNAGNYYDGSRCRQVNSPLVNLCSTAQYFNGNSCSQLVGSGNQRCNNGFYFKPYKCCLVSYWYDHYKKSFIVFRYLNIEFHIIL